MPDLAVSSLNREPPNDANTIFGRLKCASHRLCFIEQLLADPYAPGRALDARTLGGDGFAATRAAALHGESHD